MRFSNRQYSQSSTPFRLASRAARQTSKLYSLDEIKGQPAKAECLIAQLETLARTAFNNPDERIRGATFVVHRLGQAVSSIGNVPGLEDRLQRSLATVKLAESSPRLPFSEVLKTARTNTLSAYGTSSDPTGAPSTPLSFAVSREDWDIVDVFADWPESGDLKQSREMLADRLTSLNQRAYSAKY